MSIATLIRRMSEAGAPPEAIALAVEEIEALQGSLDARRAADRDRKRAQRAKDREAQETANVTGQSEDSPETVTDKGSLEVSPQTPLPKPSKTAPLTPPKSFGDAWNAMAEPLGLSKIASVSGERLRHLKARIAEHGERAVFDAIAAVKRSPHWRGENGSWAGNFDSMLRPGNFRRLIEGGYDPPKPRSSDPPSFLDQRLSERRAGAVQ